MGHRASSTGARDSWVYKTRSMGYGREWTWHTVARDPGAYETGGIRL